MTNKTDLIRISDKDFRGHVLASDDAFDALNRINPEIATIVHAHKDKILNREVMPLVARFRELQSNEKIALVRGFVDIARIESENDLGKYQVDGAVNIAKNSEIGKTTRTRIKADVSLDAQRRNYELGKYQADTLVRITDMKEKGMTSRTIISEGGMTRREGIRQNGLTERTMIETEGLIAVNRLKYDASVQMLRDHIEGQKYLSDNELSATHIKAEAYRDVEKTRERLRAETERGVSRDRLEGMIKTAAINYMGKIREAEIISSREKRKLKKELVVSYLERQTEIYLATVRASLKRDLINGEIEKERLRCQTDYYKSVQETSREGLKIVESAVNSGKESVRLRIDSGQEEIVIEYDSLVYNKVKRIRNKSKKSRK